MRYVLLAVLLLPSLGQAEVPTPFGVTLGKPLPKNFQKAQKCVSGGEQDKVLDVVEEALYWLSYRPEEFEDDIKDDLGFLAGRVVPAIEDLSPMVGIALEFFKTGFEEDRQKIKSLIRGIRQREHECDQLERELIHKIFTRVKDPLKVFHLIRLVETIGSIADHAQNASDMMRAMVAA